MSGTAGSATTDAPRSKQFMLARARGARPRVDRAAAARAGHARPPDRARRARRARHRRGLPALQRRQLWLWAACGAARRPLARRLARRHARARPQDRAPHATATTSTTSWTRFATALIGLGLGLSPYMLLAVGLVIVIAYLILSINTYLETQAFGVFALGYGGVGPDRGAPRADRAEHAARARRGAGFSVGDLGLDGARSGRPRRGGGHDRRAGRARGQATCAAWPSSSRLGRPSELVATPSGTPRASARPPAAGSRAAGGPGRGPSRAPRSAPAGRGARPSPRRSARSRPSASPRACARGCRSSSRARAARAWPCRARSRAGAAGVRISADDRGVARGARHRQVELEVELQEQVLVAQEVVARGQLALALDRRRHRGEVLLAGVHGGQLGHARLEQPARLEHARRPRRSGSPGASAADRAGPARRPRRCRRPGRGAPRARRPRLSALIASRRVGRLIRI